MTLPNLQNEDRADTGRARKDLSGCNVSQKFNFIVGIVALAVGGFIACLIYKYLIQG
jgi:hypothetical protein